MLEKAYWQGFYWLTALEDVAELARHCRACQFHAKQTYQSAQALNTIPLPWPLKVWGLNILGPFPKAVRGYEWLYMAIDKFTKWPEVTPVIKANKGSALKFIKDLVARFKVPNWIITNNGTQFMNNLFGDYCKDMGIKLCFASVAHPRGNRQVKRANAEILKGLNTRTYNKLHKHGTG
jgi:transposase InsO family protein